MDNSSPIMDDHCDFSDSASLGVPSCGLNINDGKFHVLKVNALRLEVRLLTKVVRVDWFSDCMGYQVFSFFRLSSCLVVQYLGTALADNQTTALADNMTTALADN